PDRERGVVVAEVVERGQLLAEELLVLVGVEARAEEGVGGERQHRLEVALEAGDGEADGVFSGTDLHDRAQPLDEIVDLGAGAAAGVPPHELEGVAREALLASRIVRRPAADEDLDLDERKVVLALDVDPHQSSSPPASESAASSPDGSATTTVRASGRRYAAATRTRSSAVTAATCSATSKRRRWSPEVVS